LVLIVIINFGWPCPTPTLLSILYIIFVHFPSKNKGRCLQGINIRYNYLLYNHKIPFSYTIVTKRTKHNSLPSQCAKSKLKHCIVAKITILTIFQISIWARFLLLYFLQFLFDLVGNWKNILNWPKTLMFKRYKF